MFHKVIVLSGNQNSNMAKTRTDMVHGNTHKSVWALLANWLHISFRRCTIGTKQCQTWQHWAPSNHPFLSIHRALQASIAQRTTQSSMRRLTSRTDAAVICRHGLWRHQALPSLLQDTKSHSSSTDRPRSGAIEPSLYGLSGFEETYFLVWGYRGHNRLSSLWKEQWTWVAHYDTVREVVRSGCKCAFHCSRRQYWSDRQWTELRWRRANRGASCTEGFAVFLTQIDAVRQEVPISSPQDMVQP